MALPWVLRDVTQQLDQLIARKVQLESELKVATGATVGPKNDIYAVLDKVDVNQSMKLIQTWIQKFATDRDLPVLCDKLLAIAQHYGNQEDKNKRDIKSLTPSTSDKKTTIEDKRDSSVDFFVLDTLHKIVASVIHLDGYYRRQDAFTSDPNATQVDVRGLSSVPNVIHHCFSRLHHAYSPAVRHAAATCLGVLSRHFLGTIASMFSEKFAACRNDTDRRGFASYQKAVGQLDFSVGNPDQYHETITYLTELLKNMKKIDRGVLRQEVCHSLGEIYGRILSTTDKNRLRDWDAFVTRSQAKPGEMDDWTITYDRIYQQVAKWSSKAKHSLFCYTLMCKMVCLTRDLTFFYNKKRFDVLGTIISGFKKTEFRIPCMVLTRNYVRDLRHQYVSMDTPLFVSQMKSLIQALFPKKMKPPLEEVPIITECITEIGRKHILFVVNDVMSDMLRTGASLTSLQRSSLLRALGVIASERPNDVQAYHITLGPILAPYIEDPVFRKDKPGREPYLLRAALTCFPAIRHPTMDRVQVTASYVGEMTLHEDREVSSLAAISLQRFVLLKPEENFVPTLHLLCDLLRQTDGTRPDLVLRTCQNISLILKSVSEYMSQHENEIKNGPIPFISPTQWIGCRQHVEGTALIRLCHYEGWVRTEILRMLKQMSSPEFRALETPPQIDSKLYENIPHLIDYLLPKTVTYDDIQATPEAFFRPLVEIVSVQTKFLGVFAWAWAQIYRDVEEFASLEVDHLSRISPDDDSFLLFKNHLFFLCLTLRPAGVELKDKPAPVPDAQKKKENKKEKEKIQTLGSIVKSRDRLEHFVLHPHQVYVFFDSLMRMLHLSAPVPIAPTVRRMVAKHLSMVHHSNHEELTKHIRRAVTTYEQQQQLGNASTKKPKVQFNPKTEFYYNEPVLDVFARIFSKLSSTHYHSRVSLLTKCLDDFIRVWYADIYVHHGEIQMDQPLRIKRHIANILAMYIHYRNHPNTHPNHNPKSEITKNRNPYFDFFRNLMPKQVQLIALKKEAEEKERMNDVVLLESAILHGIHELIELDPIDEIRLENKILDALQELAAAKSQFPHIQAGVGDCLEAFLKLNPHRLNDFIEKSVPESQHALYPGGLYNTIPIASNTPPQPVTESQHTRKGSIILSSDLSSLVHRESSANYRSVHTIIAAYYLRAVAHNWRSNCEIWIGSRNVSPAQMLLFSILHQCSPDPIARHMALQLAAVLAKRDAPWNKSHAQDQDDDFLTFTTTSCAFDPGFAIHEYSHESTFMYLQATYRYSSSLASNPKLLSTLVPLLQQAVKTCSYLNDTNRENILKMLLPWVSRFSALIAAMEERECDHDVIEHVVREAMMSLTALTRQCSGSSILASVMRDLWISVLSDSNLSARVVPRVCDFLLSEYGILLSELKRVSANLDRTSFTNEMTDIRDHARAHQTIESTPTNMQRKMSQPLDNPYRYSPNITPELTTRTIAPTISPSTITNAVTSSVAATSPSDNGRGAATSRTTRASMLEPSTSRATDRTSPSALDSYHPQYIPSAPSPSHSQMQSIAHSAPRRTVAEHVPNVPKLPLPPPTALTAVGAQSNSPPFSPMVDLSSPSSIISPRLSIITDEEQQKRSKQLSEGQSDMLADRALLKMICIHLSRSSFGKDVVAYLISKLRTYIDEFPVDPDAFLIWQQDRHQLGHPVSLTEQSAFQLLSNCIYEQNLTFKQHFPLLLQNAYVLFHDTGEGRDLISYIALALGLHDNEHTRTELIPITSFANSLVHSYPEIRHAWSQLAFEWALNTKDEAISLASLRVFERLEVNCFFFGDGQRTLIRLMELVYLNLRIGQYNMLPTIVKILVMPTAHPYDQRGWSALISLGWALMCYSNRERFSLGVSLLQRMFSYDISIEDQRKWILSLGRFLCRNMGEEVDTAIAEVTFKGLTSTVTCQPTLSVLQSLASCYAGPTLPSTNKLIILLMLVNVMLRCLDVAVIQKMKEASQRQTEQQKQEQEKELMLGIDDCVNLSLLVFQYSRNEQNAAKRTDLTTIATVFKNVALSISRILPDAVEIPPDVVGAMSPEEKSALALNKHRKTLFDKMVTLVRSAAEEDGESRRITKLGEAQRFLDGHVLPTPQILADVFFKAFSPLFPDPASFDFVISFFVKMLTYGPPEWKQTLLRLLGNFVHQSPHTVSVTQFTTLAELMVQSYYTLDDTEQHLIENIAWLMVNKRPAGDTLHNTYHAFNFARPRIVKNRGSQRDSMTLMDDTKSRDDRKKSSDEDDINQALNSLALSQTVKSESEDSLIRIDNQTFPILKTMVTKPRELKRPTVVPPLHSMPTVSASSAPTSATSSFRAEQLKRMSFKDLNDQTAASHERTPSSSRIQDIAEEDEHDMKYAATTTSSSDTFVLPEVQTDMDMDDDKQDEMKRKGGLSLAARYTSSLSDYNEPKRKGVVSNYRGTMASDVVSEVDVANQGDIDDSDDDDHKDDDRNNIAVPRMATVGESSRSQNETNDSDDEFPVQKAHDDIQPSAPTRPSTSAGQPGVELVTPTSSTSASSSTPSLDRPPSSNPFADEARPDSAQPGLVKKSSNPFDTPEPRIQRSASNPFDEESTNITPEPTPKK